MTGFIYLDGSLGLTCFLIIFFYSCFILFIVNVELVAIIHYYGCIWFRVGCVLFLQLLPDLLVNYGIGKAVIDEGLFYVLKCLFYVLKCLYFNITYYEEAVRASHVTSTKNKKQNTKHSIKFKSRIICHLCDMSISMT